METPCAASSCKRSRDHISPPNHFGPEIEDLVESYIAEQNGSSSRDSAVVSSCLSSSSWYLSSANTSRDSLFDMESELSHSSHSTDSMNSVSRSLSSPKLVSAIVEKEIINHGAFSSRLKKAKSFTAISEGMYNDEDSKKCVLVVEPNLVCRKMLCKVLNELSYDSDTCESYRSCVELVRKNPGRYCAIFMNMVNEDGSGSGSGSAAKTIAYLRTQLKSRAPVIIVTAHMCVEDDRVRLGADELLAKPVQAAALKQTFRRFKIGLGTIKWKDGTETIFKKLTDSESAVLNMCSDFVKSLCCDAFAPE